MLPRLAKQRVRRGGLRFSVRAWLALFLQRRRRGRAVPTPNAPVITGSSWDWNATEPGQVDVTLSFTFEHGEFPPGTIELYLQKEGTDPPVLVAETASTDTSVQDPMATDAEEFLFYTARYVAGDVTGPFSSVFSLVPWHPMEAPSDLSAADEGGGMVSMTWNNEAVQFETGYSIEGRMGANPFTQIATVGADGGSWGGPVTPGSWEFQVRAFNPGGYSDYTNTASATVT